MLDYQFIWNSFNSLHSANTTQVFLNNCYKTIGVEDPEKKSYQNCYPFIYYLEHGQNYYQLALQSPLSIKPVLLFYGMIQLLKACLLTVDPQYPESTSVLAHGVTTRKRKKQSYEFLSDEVKVQKNGLFTHFSQQMFHMKHLEGEKYTMVDLLKRLPELENLFFLHSGSKVSVPIGASSETLLKVPIEIIDSYHMTANRFIDFFVETLATKVEPQNDGNNDTDFLSFKLSNNKVLTPLTCSPLHFHLYEKKYYLPKEREQYSTFHEVMVHYLLLYNLSMISRYETEWWSELLHSYSTNDYPFIRQFLEITTDKVPYLLYLFLQEKIDINMV